MPEQVVDPQLKRRCRPAFVAGADISQRRLAQLKTLKFFARIAAAEDLLNRFAVGRGRDVRVQQKTRARITLAKWRRHDQCSAVNGTDLHRVVDGLTRAAVVARNRQLLIDFQSGGNAFELDRSASNRSLRTNPNVRRYRAGYV